MSELIKSVYINLNYDEEFKCKLIEVKWDNFYEKGFAYYFIKKIMRFP